MEIFNEELAHMTMKAEKSHDLPSASCRPRKSSGIIQYKSEGLRIRETPMANWKASKILDWSTSDTLSWKQHE